MAIPMPFTVLSVWEISHRWHDFDPDESDPKKLPRPIRERIRQLLQALTYGLNPYDANDQDILVEEIWFTGIRKTEFALKLERHLNQRIYEKEFLNSIFIRQNELERWCWRFNEPLPFFWFPEQVNRWGEIPKPPDIKPGEEPKTLSSIARQAAKKRHEPISRLKQDFFDYWSRGKFKSRADAARRFYASLPADNKRLLVASNAERTLTAALSKHLRSKDKG